VRPTQPPRASIVIRVPGVWCPDVHEHAPSPVGTFPVQRPIGATLGHGSAVLAVGGEDEVVGDPGRGATGKDVDSGDGVCDGEIRALHEPGRGGADRIQAGDRRCARWKQSRVVFEAREPALEVARVGCSDEFGVGAAQLGLGLLRRSRRCRDRLRRRAGLMLVDEFPRTADALEQKRRRKRIDAEHRAVLWHDVHRSLPCHLCRVRRQHGDLLGFLDESVGSDCREIVDMPLFPSSKVDHRAIGHHVAEFRNIGGEREDCVEVDLFNGVPEVGHDTGQLALDLGRFGVSGENATASSEAQQRGEEEGDAVCVHGDECG